MSETLSRTIPVAVLVLAGLCAMVATLFTFTDQRLWKPGYTLRTSFDDAHGVRRGDPVRIRGVNVGRVRALTIHDDAVEVELEMDAEHRVPRDSEVRLVSAGLIGGMMTSIVQGKAKEAARDGDVLRASVEAPLQCPDETLAALLTPPAAASGKGRTSGANR